MALINREDVEYVVSLARLSLSGEELEADIIVVATGLNLKVLGGARFSAGHTPGFIRTSSAFRIRKPPFA